MGHHKKEDEKTEKVIRGLLKLPENRRCINCNILGPQYVCTTFSTFVCTNCSGIHREFTHRVKSISMAKFTPEEVTALQAGGNERAKHIYLKEWDSLRHSYPDSCNIHKLRDFIKHVYVDRKFTGERNYCTLPRVRLNDKEDSYESRKKSLFRLDFKSSHSSPGARSDDLSFRYLYDESKSPKYAQKYSRRGGLSKSPIKFEVVDDRLKDDEFRNRRLSNLQSKLRALSLDSQKNVERSQPRPVTPSAGTGSEEKNSSEKVINNTESTIDLCSKSQASEDATGVETETPRMSQESGNNWASFEASKEDNAPKTPNTNTTLKSPTIEARPEPKFTNPLDLLLFELTPTTTTEIEQSSNATPTQAETHDAQDSIEEVSHAHTPSSMQYLPSASVDSSLMTQPTSAPAEVVVDKHNLSPIVPTKDDTLCDSIEQSFQTTPECTHDTKVNIVGSQPSIVETRSIERRELPEDLFTASYLSGPAPLAGWHNVQPQGMGMRYGMQFYPSAMPPSTLPFAPKSTNPFEASEGRGLIHAASFPTMASLNGAMPTASPETGLMHVSSLGSLNTMVPLSTSYATPIPPQTPFASGAPTASGVYFDQDNGEQPRRSQRIDSFNRDITGFGSLDPIQQSSGEYVTSRTPNSFSNTKRNPFE
ncbi:probable ADP-ribosylation factor GTPase-activating protein AGD14 isoform X2 [Lotus japonicus]|uniref:probable ADP-ribosylation factor GTPase-activating protein AGD14 isoform X2 n=1 Tax=Lotus japonicus TaxID=34305 RepID=UPI002589DE63|nr:probable ADP-ribosylation factor GTPase-activating protein AGD14 isoform X2 [Lotus japonicus]